MLLDFIVEFQFDQLMIDSSEIGGDKCLIDEVFSTIPIRDHSMKTDTRGMEKCSINNREPGKFN